MHRLSTKRPFAKVGSPLRSLVSATTVLWLTLSFVQAAASAPGLARPNEEGILNFGFHAHLDPVSYSAGQVDAIAKDGPSAFMRRARQASAGNS